MVQCVPRLVGRERGGHDLRQRGRRGPAVVLDAQLLTRQETTQRQTHIKTGLKVRDRQTSVSSCHEAVSRRWQRMCTSKKPWWMLRHRFGSRGLSAGTASAGCAAAVCRCLWCAAMRGRSGPLNAELEL